MEKFIADVLETEPWTLWPERYGPDGKSNRINRWYLRGKSNTKKAGVNQKILGEGSHETD